MRTSLFLVRCRGMQTALGGEAGHGTAYVVAKDPHEAYEKVRASLDRRDLGTDSDRQMLSVELLAEDYDYSPIAKLYL